MKQYKIALLKGDGIGPEIVEQAVKVLDVTAKKFGFSVEYDPADIGGIAIDNCGEPLPQITIDKCKNSDSVLLGAVGGAKWDNQPSGKRPESGLLGIRGALGLFANLRPAVIFEPLKKASPIKDDAALFDAISSIFVACSLSRARSAILLFIDFRALAAWSRSPRS